MRNIIYAYFTELLQKMCKTIYLLLFAHESFISFSLLETLLYSFVLTLTVYV